MRHLAILLLPLCFLLDATDSPPKCDKSLIRSRDTKILSPPSPLLPQQYEPVLPAQLEYAYNENNEFTVTCENAKKAVRVNSILAHGLTCSEEGGWQTDKGVRIAAPNSPINVDCQFYCDSWGEGVNVRNESSPHGRKTEVTCKDELNFNRMFFNNELEPVGGANLQCELYKGWSYADGRTLKNISIGYERIECKAGPCSARPARQEDSLQFIHEYHQQVLKCSGNQANSLMGMSVGSEKFDDLKCANDQWGGMTENGWRNLDEKNISVTCAKYCEAMGEGIKSWSSAENTIAFDCHSGELHYKGARLHSVYCSRAGWQLRWPDQNNAHQYRGAFEAMQFECKAATIPSYCPTSKCPTCPSTDRGAAAATDSEPPFTLLLLCGAFGGVIMFCLIVFVILLKWCKVANNCVCETDEGRAQRGPGRNKSERRSSHRTQSEASSVRSEN